MFKNACIIDIKNGRRNNIQRFKCVKCKKIFTYRTLRFFANFRESNKSKVLWNIYNFQRFTALEEISKTCFISLPTSYTWRHKIMTWLQFHGNGFKQLEGLIEIDSTYFNKSFKGQRNYFREDYDNNSYGKFIKRKCAISSQKLCITTAIDRNKHIGYTRKI